MFGMGLTIKREDFQIVFSRPKEVISGCILQYTIMPLAAYFLAVVMNLDTDIALGVILVGCCPGGTAATLLPTSLRVTFLIRGHDHHFDLDCTAGNTCAGVPAGRLPG